MFQLDLDGWRNMLGLHAGNRIHDLSSYTGNNSCSNNLKIERRGKFMCRY